MYEEVTLMKPFRRKTLVLIGASGVARRSLKQKILNADPDQFASPLPHTSRPKRAEEDSGMRYWFVDREDMEYSIRNHEFLEYGELKVFFKDIYFKLLKMILPISGQICIDQINSGF